MTLSNQNSLSYLGVTTYDADNVLSPVIATRAPTSLDKHYPIGQPWINKTTGASYQLTNFTAGAPTWATLGGSAADVNTINTLPPTGGNITIAGTANQLSVANAGSTVTFSLPAAIIAPGSLTTTTSLTATTTVTAGTGITSTTGNIVATAGAVNAGTTMTAGTGITATTGNIVATAGQVNAGTTMTAGTGITATTGNIVATAGQVNAGTTMTAGTGITATTGNIVATAGAVNAGTTMTAGTGITATTGNISATAGAVNAGTSMTATAGDITATLGHVIINGAAKQLRVHGGAVTDFIGQATLTNGTVTVANTNIAATDRVFVTRTAKNGSTAYGVPQVTVTAATNFVLTACKSDTTTETNDASTFDYFIVRQV